MCANAFIVPLSIGGLFFAVAKVSGTAFIIGLLLFLIQFTSYFYVFIINPGIPYKRLSLFDEFSINRIINNPYFIPSLLVIFAARNV